MEGRLCTKFRPKRTKTPDVLNRAVTAFCYGSVVGCMAMTRFCGVSEVTKPTTKFFYIRVGDLAGMRNLINVQSYYLEIEFRVVEKHDVTRLHNAALARFRSRWFHRSREVPAAVLQKQVPYPDNGIFRRPCLELLR